MKKLLFVLVAGATACGFAEPRYWGANSGNWFTPASWKYGVYPQSMDDMASFLEADQSGPVTVTFGGQNAVAHSLRVSGPVGVTDNNGPFVKPVTFQGSGETVNLRSGAEVGYRRKVIFDNIKIVATTDAEGGYLYGYGKTVFRNGASWDYVNDQNYGGTMAPGAEMTVDNAAVRFFAYDFSPGGKVTVKNGGKIGWTHSYSTETDAEKFWGVDWNVIDGDVSHCWLACYTAGFFPKRSGTFISGGKGVKAYNPRDAKWRLGGTADLTGGGGQSMLYTTNNAAIYGRGVLKLFAFAGAAGTTNAYDLSEITICSTWEDKAVSYLLGDKRIRWDSESPQTPGIVSKAANHWRGDNTFYCSTNGTAVKWTLSKMASVSRDTAFRFIEGVAGSTAGADFSFTDMPVFRLGALELGNDVTVLLRPNYYYAVHTHDFKIGANSVLNTLYSFNLVRALGEVSVDPTARIYVPGADKRSAGQAPDAFFCALDAIPDGVVCAKTGTTGNFVSRVGGCCFYWDGTFAPTAANYTWNGSVDGNWSTAENWTMSGPTTGRGATFHTYAHTVSTNDIADLVTPCVRFDNTSGPCILRGNPVKLTATAVDSWDSAVANNSKYPQIIEFDVSSDAAVFGVSSRHQSSAIAPLCFRGKVDVPNGAFAPTGIAVIDGTLNAKELQLLNMTQVSTASGVTAENSPTLLTVRKTGTVNIANQVAEHSTTSMLWIAKGGQVNLTGDWVSTGYPNEHVVKGTFAVSGKLGGTKTQTYIGKGVLKAGTTDGTGGAKLRIGEGLTVVPTTSDFGSMPIEVAYGSVTIAPTVAGTLSQDVDVAALGSVVTVTNDADYVLSGAWQGYDFDLVKKGTGKLTLDTTLDSSGRGYVTVDAGTLVWTEPQTLGKLIAKPGTKLVARNGAPLTLGLDVDLTGVEISTDASTYEPLLTVPEDCVIKGAPTSQGKCKFKTVVNADGSTSLLAKKTRGMVIIVY